MTTSGCGATTSGCNRSWPRTSLSGNSTKSLRNLMMSGNGPVSAPAAVQRQPAVGSSFDSALAETINGLYKTELIKPRKPWRTIEEVELATAEWVDWFNHRRLYEYCGDLPPAEMEDAHYAQIKAQPLAELSNR